MRFVQNDKGIGQGAPAHEGQRRHFDVARFHPLDHLIAGHHVVQGVVQRAQIGIDLFFHVARQKAQLFAGFNRRSGQNDAIHVPVQKALDRFGHRQIGFPRARRAEPEHQFAFVDGLEVRRLVGRSGRDHALFGANRHIHVGDIAARTAHHAQGGGDLVGADQVALGEAVIQSHQYAFSHVHGVHRTRHGQIRAAFGDGDVQRLFHLGQMKALRSEQGLRQRVVGERQVGGVCGVFAHAHAQALCPPSANSP